MRKPTQLEAGQIWRATVIKPYGMGIDIGDLVIITNDDHCRVLSGRDAGQTGYYFPPLTVVHWYFQYVGLYAGSSQELFGF
jgi:hypothetical protein